MSEKTMGQVAFEAYRAEVKTAFNGDPIPEWDRLDNGAPARRGWERAADAVQVETAAQQARLTAEPRRDFRKERVTRWTPVGNPPPPAEVESLPPGAKHEPNPAPPVGDGGPVGGWYLTGEPVGNPPVPGKVESLPPIAFVDYPSVPIDVEPDTDRD